ncbi:hypothetical protein H4R27_006544, partial [Coemansia aciculifera]
DENTLLEELHVTDSPSEKPESHDFKCEKKLMAVIRLPAATAEGLAQFKEMLEFVFYLVDYISEAITLRPESMRKLGKAREEAYKEFTRMAEQEKQDALAKTLAEKRRIELEGVDKMSPEQRRKWEEKDRKKQLKKEQSKRVRRQEPFTSVVRSKQRSMPKKARASRNSAATVTLYADNDTAGDSDGSVAATGEGHGEKRKRQMPNDELEASDSVDEDEARPISAQEEADLSSALIAKLLAEDSGGGAGGGGSMGYYADYGNGAGVCGEGLDEYASGSEPDEEWDPNAKGRRAAKGAKARKQSGGRNARSERVLAGSDSDRSEGDERQPRGGQKKKKPKVAVKKTRAPPEPVVPGQFRSGAYTDEEERMFNEGLELFGRSWGEISGHVVTRDAKSIRSHAQKYFIKLFRDGVALPAK